MSAGLFPAGAGGAGFAPVYITATTTPTLPRAVRFDPSTRQYVQNADGTMADVHPVDQRVDFLLFMEEGSIPSAVNVGNRIRRRTSRVDPKQVKQIATDEVRRVLAPLIDAGDIVLLSVDADTSVPSRKIFSIAYVNLRDPLTDPGALAASARKVRI